MRRGPSSHEVSSSSGCAGAGEVAGVGSLLPVPPREAGNSSPGPARGSLWSWSAPLGLGPAVTAVDIMQNGGWRSHLQRRGFGVLFFNAALLRGPEPHRPVVYIYIYIHLY